MAQVYKTCNCCLERNKTPVMMGARARVRYCRKCHQRTVWGDAEAHVVAAKLERNARVAELIRELLEED